jgi:hypothetical protein
VEDEIGECIGGLGRRIGSDTKMRKDENNAQHQRKEGEAHTAVVGRTGEGVKGGTSPTTNHCERREIPGFEFRVSCSSGPQLP